MTQSERVALAEAYIEHYSNPHEWDKDMVLLNRDNSATQWASDAIMDLSFEDPEVLWEFILEVLQRDPPTEVVEVLAAGPLEDYLAKYGEKVIDRVEARAKSDPNFRSLLGGVWRNSMSDEVWARVQASWDRSEWDDGA
jgi:hypothetical protein